MALAAALHAWRSALRDLQEGLETLRLTLGDAPEAHVLTDLFGEPLEELLGALAETQERAEGFEASAPPPAALMRFVTEASEGQGRALRTFLLELAPLERVAELAGAAQERTRVYGGDDGGWQAWAAGVVSDLSRCQRLLLRVSGAFQRLLREVAERAEAAPALVQATNIGQQIALPPDASTRDPFAAPPFTEVKGVT